MTARRKRVVYRVQWKRDPWRLASDPIGPAMGWLVSRAGVPKTWFRLKADALYETRRNAQQERAAGTPTQLVVHNKNGRIAFEHTYGADPRRRRG